MKIKQPHIFRDGLFRREYIRILENYAAFYNEGKKNGEKLKGEHIGLLDELIYYAQIVVNKGTVSLLKEDQELASMEIGNYIKVNLSKYLIAAKLENKRHPDTVKRWKRRLIEAGAIISDPKKFEELKIAKSHRNDVLINPDLVLIYDLDNSQYTPFTRFFSETDKQVIWKEKWTNCSSVSGIGTLPDSINNEIMPVDTVEKGVSHAVDEKQENHSNRTKPDSTPKQCAPSETSKENPKENGEENCKNAQNVQQDGNKASQVGRAVPKNVKFEAQLLQKRDKKTDMRRALAVELYTFMVQMLFKWHNIFPGEAHMAIEYLQEKYFSTAESPEHGQKMMKGYKWRVSKAASYNQRHNRDFSNVYPVRYLNVNNKKGFVATKDWYVKHLRDKKRKYDNRMNDYQRIAEQSLMKQIMDEYSENRTVANFNRQSAWLGQEHPHLLQTYVQQVGKLNKITH